ncbi:MAG: GIY-YIG nuclease family protein [Flavobacteriales bacterium]|nr:GIY-YIG nuclease family protein [Flavobacteriales bacterium]
MEFIVYILYSKKFDKTYVGYTSSLIERFKSHNELAKSGYTVRFRPWEVVYLEVFQSKTQAIVREKWFKSGHGRKFTSDLKSTGFISA